MSNYFLLIDFGASHTKSSLLNLESNTLEHVYTCTSLKNCVGIPHHYEISPKDLHQQFLQLCQYYLAQEFSIAGIVICSQMHGFILLDENNQPLTNYISWCDERATLPIQGESILDLIRMHFGEQFKAITGMRARAGLPFLNVLHYGRTENFSNRKIKLISLPEWIAMSCNDAQPIVHETMLAGSGFYDIHQRVISKRLTEFVRDQTGSEIIFNEVAHENEVAGYFHYKNKKIPIYNGVGDMQCALLGAGIHPDAISINIGTGSQVAKIACNISLTDLERRPFFMSQQLVTQTHIPAGRALNEFVNFFHSVVQFATGQTCDAWNLMKTLQPKDILHAKLEIDLAIFQSAFNYQGGGKIANIVGNFTAKDFLASLLKSLLMQYQPIVEKLQTKEKSNVVILSGGIPKKLPILKEVLEILTKNKISQTASQIDETLVGLQIQAQAIVTSHNT